MTALTYAQLTEAQRVAVAQWWDANDPDEVNFECVDNVRYAIKGNAEQESAYENLRDSGCCGFFDTELEVTGDDESPDFNHILLFGFNYGH